MAEEVTPMLSLTVRCLGCSVRQSYRWDDLRWVPIEIETGPDCS